MRHRTRARRPPGRPVHVAVAPPGYREAAMTLPLPTSLSPSKVSSFKDCALAFRYSAIDRLPEPPSPWAAKGTLVHRALELLFWEEAQGDRTIEAALAKLDRARQEILDGDEFGGLGLTPEEE